MPETTRMENKKMMKIYENNKENMREVWWGWTMFVWLSELGS